MQAVTGREKLDRLRQESWSWYLNYLELRLTPLEQTLTVPIFSAHGEEWRSTDLAAKTEVLKTLRHVAGNLFGYGEVTLRDIAASLKAVPPDCESCDTNGPPLLREDQGDLGSHLAFQVTGWLTGIWDPLPDVSSPVFRVEGSLPPRRRAGIRPDPILRNTVLSIHEWQHQPLHRIAGRFGMLFPSPDLSLRDDTLGSRDVESACLTAVYVSWHSLENIMDMELVWTGTLAQHLEYDQHRKKLYVFKYPSICLLLCREGPQTLLSDVFKQQQQNPTDQQNRGLQDMEFDGYLSEVLLSYPLIFARYRKSRKSIKRRFAELGEECDPLLKTLCTANQTSAEMKSLYQELNADPAENYVPIADFPFLARKLFQLQKANMGRHPHSLRNLWNDRRSLGIWLALWAALIITTLTLFFQIWQLVFQIWTPNGV